MDVTTAKHLPELRLEKQPITKGRKRLNMPVLECPRCSKKFGLFVGTGASSPDRLGDPFEAMCIHCEKISNFDKAAIRTISVKNPGMFWADE